MIFFTSCEETTVTSEVFLMDSFMVQTIHGADGEKIAKQAEEVVKNLEETYSAYKENSLISEINENAGIKPVKVPDEVFNLIKECVVFSEKSNGLFDLTIAPLTKLWAITSDNPKVPTLDEIDYAKSLINYNNVILDEENKTVFLKEKCMKLDFGATVKGYAAQKVLEIYKTGKINGGVLSLGGNVAVYGSKNDGTAFKIGVRDPKKSSTDYFAILETDKQVISTSGAYERYFKQNGVTYHHILNPKTGYPCESDLLSVTVVSENGLLSDYLSTLFYMLGKDVVKEHLNEEDYSLIVIDKKDNIYISDNLKDSFTLLNDTDYKKGF